MLGIASGIALVGLPYYSVYAAVKAGLARFDESLRRELLEHLYDFTWEHHSNVIEAHVSNLRKKLRLTTDSAVLENHRGRGYRLAAES